MKTSQNVLKMSTVSPDVGRETATPLTDGYNPADLCTFHKLLKLKATRPSVRHPNMSLISRDLNL